MTGVAVDEIMAFGDGQNDVSMLAAAGVGVAMENAVEDCRRAAKRIAPRNTGKATRAAIVEHLKGRTFLHPFDSDEEDTGADIMPPPSEAEAPAAHAV